MNTPTARGAITIRTADGVEIGHGWGEVRVGRDPSTGQDSVLGEVREMTWSTGLAPTDAGQAYRIVFHGGPAFVVVFEGPFPDTARRGARFRPRGPATDPIGPRSAVWGSGFPARGA